MKPEIEYRPTKDKPRVVTVKPGRAVKNGPAVITLAKSEASPVFNPTCAACIERRRQNQAAQKAFRRKQAAQKAKKGKRNA